MLRDKIFEEIRRLNLEEGHVWTFHTRNNFIFSLNPLEKKGFYEEMETLCNEGIFTKEGTGVDLMYRLTKKGVDEIYSC